MWSCRICEKKTKKRANIVRHLKLVHGIDDIDFKNVIKDTNIGVESYDPDRSPVCSNELQSRMMEKGRPLSEDYREIPYKVSQLRMEEKHEYEPRSISDDTKEKIDRFEKEDKCHILDSILDIFPDNLKADAKDICNTLKCRNDIIIKHNWEIAVHGYTIRGSNVYTLIVNELTRRGKKFA